MENEEVGGLEGVLLGLEHEADFQEIPRQIDLQIDKRKIDKDIEQQKKLDKKQKKPSINQMKEQQRQNKMYGIELDVDVTQSILAQIMQNDVSESVAEGVNVIAKDYCSKLIEAALEVKDQRGGRKEDPLIPEDIIVASRKLKQGGLISNRIALGI